MDLTGRRSTEVIEGIAFMVGRIRSQRWCSIPGGAVYLDRQKLAGGGVAARSACRGIAARESARSAYASQLDNGCPAVDRLPV